MFSRLFGSFKSLKAACAATQRTATYKRLLQRNSYSRRTTLNEQKVKNLTGRVYQAPLGLEQLAFQPTASALR
jgi:hypothetical protein